MGRVLLGARRVSAACDGGDLPASIDRHGAVPGVPPAGERERRDLPEVRGDVAWADLGLVGKRPPTLSDRSLSLIRSERQASYGPPDENLRRIGVAWAAIFDCPPIPPHKVALAMAALKLTRAAHRPDDDSLVDAVGYLEIAYRLRPSSKDRLVDGRPSNRS